MFLEDAHDHLRLHTNSQNPSKCPKVSLHKVRKFALSKKTLQSKQEDLRRAFRHSLYGEILYNNQEYNSALLEFQKALPIFIQTLGKKHRNTIDIYVKLGETHQVLENYETALLNFKNALRFSSMDQKNHDLSNLYEKIAQIEFKKGSYQEVQDFLEKLLEILIFTKGLNSLEVANCHERFGKLYVKIGQYEQAIHSFSKALAIKQRNSAELSTAFHSLAWAYNEKGEYTKACEMIQQALETTPNVETYQVLAKINYNLGDYEAAIANLTTSIDLYSASNPNFDRVYLAQLHNDLASGYSYKGDLELSYQYYQKALSLLANKNRTNYPETADAFLGLGQYHYLKGRPLDSLEFYQKSLKLYKLFFAPDHPCFVTCYNFMGLAYGLMTNYKEGFHFLEEGLKVALKNFKELHLSVVNSLNSIGMLLYQLKIQDQALVNFQKAILILKKLFPNGHPLFMTLYNNAAFSASSQTDRKYAFQYLLNSIKLCLKYYGSLESKTCLLCGKIGTFLLRTNSYDQAIQMFQKALILQDRPVKKHEQIHQQILYAEKKQVLQNLYQEKI